MLHRFVSRVTFLATKMSSPMMTLQLDASENSRAKCTLKFRLNLLPHFRSECSIYVRVQSVASDAKFPLLYK